MNFRRITALALLGLLLLGAGSATAGAQTVEDINQTFGGPDGERVTSVIQTDDGGYAIAASTESFGSGDRDVWFIKTDSNGNEVINKTFGGVNSDRPRSVVQTDDGGYAIAGFTESFSEGGEFDRDAWLIKTDSNGNEVINETYGEPGPTSGDSARSIVQTDDGGYAIAGITSSFGSGSSDFWLIKTDSNGVEQFNRTYGGADFERGDSITRTSDGGFAITGVTDSFGSGNRAAWLVKTDSNGNEQFNETYGGNEGDKAGSVVQTDDGGYALAGYTDSFASTGFRDAWLVKTGSNGNEQFNRTFADGEEANSVVQTNDGGFALVGRTEGTFNAWLVKTDSNGNKIFEDDYGGGGFDGAESVIQTNGGGYALGGSTESFASGGNDAWLLKVSLDREIASCRDIVAPGKYRLTTNLTDRPEESCIDITSSDVVFDGQGHTIDGVGDFGTVGVNVTASSTLTNVTVRNVTTTDWDEGIRYEEVDDGKIIDNNASGNTNNGIKLRSSSDNNVTNNTALDNDDDGIQLAASSGNNVTGNNANSNNRHGISLLGSSSNNNLTDNNASSNSQTGFFLQQSTNNNLTDNTARNNSGLAAFYSRQGSVDNIVKNLDIGMSTNPETTLTFKDSKDVYLESVDNPPSDPSGASNISRYVDITATNTDSFVDLTVNYDDSDVSSGIPEGNLRLWKNDGSWSPVSGSTVDTTKNEVSANITSFSVFAPLSADPEVSSCRDIVAPGEYRLTTDLTDRPEQSCINVTSSDVVFDGQGHIVDGVGDSGTTGIKVTSSSTLTNVTVRNVTVTDWDEGILYDDADDGRIAYNNVSSNVGEGIRVFSSGGNELTGNNVSSNLEGIEIDSSNDNLVTNNTARNNADWDFFSDSGTVKMNDTYGGADFDQARSVAQTSDGGFALAGRTQSFGGSDNDAWLIKTDENGNEEFNKTFGGQDTDRGRSVVQTNDGGYAVAGTTRSFDSGGTDAWLLKTDANGNVEINKTFGGPNFDGTFSLVQTEDGGFALAGSTSSFSSGFGDAWLIKTDANGNEEFNETFGGLDADNANSVVQTSDGGFALGGKAQSFGPGFRAAWLIKTDQNGNEEINETYGGSSIEVANSVVETSDGGFALGGRTRSFGGPDRDAWLLKTDSSGNEQFNQSFGGEDSDVANSVVQTDDNSFALGGKTSSFGPGFQAAWLIKTDENGNEKINETFGGSTNEQANSVVETSDGGLALGGDTDSFGSGNRDAWLVAPVENENNTVRNLDIGTSTNPDTTLTFEDSEDIALESVESPPSDPSGEMNIGRYVNITDNSADSFVNLTVNYDESDTTGIIESSLSLWKNNGSWSEVPDSTVDTANNEVSASIDSFSTFAPLGASSNIASCKDITAPGEYRLTTDLTDRPEQSCINITSSGVVLDGQGHTVDGVDDSGTIGVDVTGSSTLTNVTVRNVTVTDWDNGIRYEDSNAGKIIDNKASGNGDEGISLLSSSDNNVTNNNASGNSRNGIFLLSSSDNNEVTSNTANGNDGNGIRLDSPDNGVADNTANRNSRSGIVIRSSSGNDVTDNDVSENSRSGIELLLANGNNVTRNDAKRNDGSGIRFSDSSDNTVADNNASSNDFNGITLTFFGTGSNRNTVTNNTASANRFAGIRLSESSDNNLTDNDVGSDNREGILLRASSDNNLTGNDAKSNSLGIQLDGSSDNNTVADNNASANENIGISLSGSDDNTLTDNTANDNENRNGVILRNSSDNTLTDNAASGNGRDGIRLTFDPFDDAGSDNNTLTNNNASGNSRNGIFLSQSSGNALSDNTARNNDDSEFESESGSVNNTVSGLDIGTSTNPDTTLTFEESKDIALDSVDSPPSDPAGEKNIGRYVEITDNSADAFVNLTVNYDDSDIPQGAFEKTLDLWKNDGSWSEVSGSTLDTTNNEVSTNITSFSVFAPLGNGSVNSCMDITSPGDYRLRSDLTDRTEQSCVNITSSNVAFDGQGHTIDGVDSFGTVGVNVTGTSTLTNVTVRNVTVMDWGDGIRFDDVEDSNVTDSRANSNRDGIELRGSDRNDVSGNDADSNIRNGVHLESSDDNEVTDNNATSSTMSDGILLESSSSNNVSDNDASSNARDGINVSSSSDVNRILDNKVTDNAEAGIDVSSSTANDLERNGVSDNRLSGIRLIDSSASRVADNVVTGNNEVGDGSLGGILIESGNANFLADNTARNNGVWEYRSVSVTSNNTVERLDIGMSTEPDTTLSFDAKNVGLSSVDSPPADPGSGNEENIGRYVNATNTSTASYLDITFRYTNADVSDVAEPTLGVWKYNGTWIELPSQLDTGANTVSTNVTRFSVLAPLGKQTGGGPPDDVPGFGDECRRNRGRGSGDCPNTRDRGRNQDRFPDQRRNRGRGRSRGR